MASAPVPAAVSTDSSHSSHNKSGFERSSIIPDLEHVGCYTGCQLKLHQVISHATVNHNSFAYHARSSIFAVCAGSMAIVNHVDEASNIKQRHYRASSGIPRVSSSAYFESVTSSPLEKRGRGLEPSRRIWGATSSPFTEGKASPTPLTYAQKSRSVTSLAISPDGKYLAVGEIGHTPRILLFSLGSDGEQGPIAEVHEHAYAVKCLAFSPDSRFLVSVGDVHDGFICLWSLGARTGSLKLQASNKCIAVIHEVSWMGLYSFITVGIRHVKIWRPEKHPPSSPTNSRAQQRAKSSSVPSSPAPTGLPGRNVLLASLQQASFTAVKAFSNCSAVIGSDKGDIALLTSTAGSHKLQKVFEAGAAVRCITLDRIERFLWVGCQSGTAWAIPIAQLAFEASHDPWKPFEIRLGYAPVGLAIFDNSLLAMDPRRAFHFYSLTANSGTPTLGPIRAEMFSHSAPVAGASFVRDTSGGNFFVTYDTTGSVMFWTVDGNHQGSGEVMIEQHGTDPNELRILRPSASGDAFLAGDKNGFLRYIVSYLGS